MVITPDTVSSVTVSSNSIVIASPTEIDFTLNVPLFEDVPVKRMKSPTFTFASEGS